jgi:hypothetical protein
MDKQQIISDAYRVFSSFSRPEHFTNYDHCEECAEHDETMRECSLSDIGPEQVGNPGWSPIPFLTDDAFGYVLPRLLEMALENISNSDSDPFVFQYLLALTPLPENRSFSYFTPEQINTVRQSLYYIRDQLGSLVADECCEENLDEAITLWQKITPNNLFKPKPE